MTGRALDEARRLVVAAMVDLMVEALDARDDDGLVLGQVAPTVREGLEAAAADVARLGVDRLWLEVLLDLEAEALMAGAVERALVLHAERRRIRVEGAPCREGGGS